MKILTILLGLLAASLAIADTDRPTKFLNQGGVANPRHNMTQRQPAGGGPAATGASGFASRASAGPAVRETAAPGGAGA